VIKVARLPPKDPQTVLALQNINLPNSKEMRHGTEETLKVLTYDTYLRREEGHSKEYRGKNGGGSSR